MSTTATKSKPPDQHAQRRKGSQSKSASGTGGGFSFSPAHFGGLTGLLYQPPEQDD
jgi:hypothetical protein